MDHHQGFGDNAADILLLEQRLVRDADIRLFTSDGWPSNGRSEANRPSAVLRNAADFSQFSSVPASIYRDRLQRSVIGYYGAIAGLVRPRVGGPDCSRPFPSMSCY